MTIENPPARSQGQAAEGSVENELEALRVRICESRTIPDDLRSAALRELDLAASDAACGFVDGALQKVMDVGASVDDYLESVPKVNEEMSR